MPHDGCSMFFSRQGGSCLDLDCSYLVLSRAWLTSNSFAEELIVVSSTGNYLDLLDEDQVIVYFCALLKDLSRLLKQIQVYTSGFWTL